MDDRQLVAALDQGRKGELHAFVTRRVFTVTLVVALAALTFGLLPVWLVVAAVVDLALRRRRWPTVRFLLFYCLYLCCQCYGMLGAGWVWSTDLLGYQRHRYVDRNYRLQWNWGWWLYKGAVWLYDMGVQAKGEEVLSPGPYLFFIRHSSSADAVLPLAFLSYLREFRLRYVIKRELMYDPCMDLVGHRIFTVFVDRGGDRTGDELQAVKRLLVEMRPTHAVVLYPEGTRFTDKKKARILEKLAEQGNTDLYERTLRLRHLLPPRLGGSMALLEDNPGLDVVFCAHVGLEGATDLPRFLRGDLIGRQLHLQYWRARFADIPEDREGRVAWLMDWWQRMDDWVDEHLEASGVRRA